MKADFILISTAIFLLAGCAAKEDPSGNTEQQEEKLPPVELELSSTVESKTTLGELSGGVYQVYWTDGDRICVNGVKSSALLGVAEKTTGGKFVVEGVKAPYYVVYPSIRCGSIDGDGLAAITLPPVQAYKKNTFASGAAMLYGSSDGEKFALNNLCCVVRIPVLKGADYGDKLTSLTLSSVSAESPLSGSATLDTKTGNLEWTAGNGSLMLSLPPEGIDLEETQPEYFYLCVPHGDYADGLDLVLSSSEGTMLCSWNPGTGLSAGVMVTIEPIAFKPKSTKLIDGIDSWNEFATAVNEGNYDRWIDEDTHEATVVADISYGGDLTYILSLPSGLVLNGNGHTISRAQATEALIIAVEEGATVKNLTVGGTRVAASATVDRGTGNLAAYNRGLIENCVNDMGINLTGVDANTIVGGLVTDNAGEIRDCKNTGDIAISMSITANRIIYGGGICARGFRPLNNEQKCGKIIRCENKGSITLYRTATGNYSLPKLAFGGIVGCVDGGDSEGEFCLIEDCVNNGNITIWQDSNHTNTNYSYSVGGILGRCCVYSNGPDYYYTVGGANATAHEGYYVKITGCTNTAAIDVSIYSQTFKATDSGARQVYVGGIVGCLQSHWNDYAEVKNCTSTGPIRTGHLAATDITGGIVGGAGYVTIEGCKSDVFIGQSKNNLANPTYMGLSGAIVGAGLRDMVVKDCEGNLVYDKGTVAGRRGTGYVGLAAKNGNIKEHVAAVGYATISLEGTNNFSGTIDGVPVTVDNVACAENVGKITGTVTIK